jgi:hypothetical protein
LIHGYTLTMDLPMAVGVKQFQIVRHILAPVYPPLAMVYMTPTRRRQRLAADLTQPLLPLPKKAKTKSAMLQMDNPVTTDGERHRP